MVVCDKLENNVGNTCMAVSGVCDCVVVRFRLPER